MPGSGLGCAGRQPSAVRVVGRHGPGTTTRSALALPTVDLPTATDLEPPTAWCRCGATLPAGAPPHVCAGAEALDHTRRVSARAQLLIARVEAVRALGTLTGDLRPLSAFTR